MTKTKDILYFKDHFQKRPVIKGLSLKLIDVKYF